MAESTSRTVLITGASAGIGEACARRFAAGGDRLVLVARRRERLEQFARTCQTPTHIMAVDVADRESVSREFGELPAEFAEVDILVNNAGVGLGMGPAQEADLDDWQRMVETNISGVLHLVHAILPGMVARNRGHIVNIGSVSGSFVMRGSHVYSATKAFVHHLSRSLLGDLSGSRVRVTTLEPGMVETEFLDVRLRGDRERRAAIRANVDPLTSDDMAELIHYCTGLPERINVSRLEVMPVSQAYPPGFPPPARPEGSR